MKNIFLATAKNGELNFGSDANNARLRDVLKHNEGKTFRLEMLKSTRTLSQNRFYWLYLNVIAQETGDDANSLHEYFSRTFLPPRFIKAMGKEIKIPATTTTLSKTDFSEYLDRISGLTNIPIPNPSDAGFYTDY